MDGTSVGVYLFLDNLDIRGSRFADDLCERRMRKRQCRRRHCHWFCYGDVVVVENLGNDGV